MNEAIMKFRDETTARLIEAIKSGTAPWQRPWNGSYGAQNAVSHRLYNGINQILLMAKGMEIDGGADPRWLTYRQAVCNGWKIKKGSKGTHVILWKPIIAEKGEELCDDKILGVMQRVFTVFHASQIDGIGEYRPILLSEFEAQEKAEQIIAGSQAKIIHCGNEAFYEAVGDYIQLPVKGDFKSVECYYSTLLHELIHWTGHSSRLDRLGGYYRSKSNRALEELVAEIGSMFLSCEAGIPQSEGEFQNHASYIDSWIKCLESDNNAIFKAAAQASRASDFLLKRS